MVSYSARKLSCPYWSGEGIYNYPNKSSTPVNPLEDRAIATRA